MLRSASDQDRFTIALVSCTVLRPCTDTTADRYYESTTRGAMLYVVLGDVDYERYDTLIAVHDDQADAVKTADTAWGEIRVVPMDVGTIRNDDAHKHAYPHLPVYTRERPPTPPRVLGEATDSRWSDAGVLLENDGPTYVRGEDGVIRKAQAEYHLSGGLITNAATKLDEDEK